MSALNTAPKLSTSRIWTTGMLAVAAAIVANVIARAILIPLLGLAPDFRPFGYSAIAMFTAMGTILGLVVFWIISRRSAAPFKTFNIVAAVAGVLSIIPNIGAMLNPAAAPFPGTAVDYAVLIIFHLIAAVVFVGVLNARLKP
jgi:low temperature requirement protein LtrA